MARSLALVAAVLVGFFAGRFTAPLGATPDGVHVPEGSKVVTIGPDPTANDQPFAFVRLPDFRNIQIPVSQEVATIYARGSERGPSAVTP